MLVEFETDIVNCLNTLRKGGIILYPTDTIWGVGCDATDPAAVKKIYEIKQRPESKSLIVLLADPRDIYRYISLPEPYIFDYLKTAVRPTTIIYEGAVGLAENLIAADGSIAIRVVKEDFCRNLIKRFGKPLVSTSANISGAAYPRNYLQVPDAIKNGVDYIVKHRQNDFEINAPSTIIKLSNNNEIEFIRQ